MTWHVFSGEAATEAEREAIRQHLRSRMLGIKLRHFGDKDAQNSVELTVYGERLRDLATTEPPAEITGKLIAAATAAVEDAFQTLVVDADQLPPPGDSADGTYERSRPAVRVDIVLHGLEPKQAEVGISMPDPRIFREALAHGDSLASIARSTVASLGRDLEVGMRREIVDRQVLSR